MQPHSETQSVLQTLLAELERLDIKLWVEGERLRFEAPQGALQPELRARLQAHKKDLIDFLSQADSSFSAETGDPVFRQDGARVFPLSFAQQHFGVLQTLHPNECYYNVPFGFRLDGRLDEAILHRSFEAIVERHDFLRTTLQQVDGTLMQIVAPTGRIHLTMVDLQDLSVVEQDQAIRREVHTECYTPFDLSRESALRVRLLKLAEDRHILLFCLHNTLFEAGSLRALLNELGQHYQAFLNGQPSSLPPLPMQYADGVRWQQSLLSTGLDARLNYWREWFARGEPPLITLAMAGVEVPPTGFRAAALWSELSPELTQKIKALSQQSGVTLFMTLLAAYAVVLHRCSGDRDIVMGTTSVNRNHWKLEPLIGSLLNVLALRFDLSGHPNFLTLFNQVRKVVLTAFAQQEVPFRVIAPLLQPGQQRTTPLFRTVFTFLGEMPKNQLQLAEIKVELMEEVYGEVMFPDLYPAVWEKPTPAGTVLRICWQYKQDLFDEKTAAEQLQQFVAVLETMVHDPSQRI